MAWHTLLEEVLAAEKAADAPRLRAAYAELLRAYPLCFGFWKRHAEHELRHASLAHADAAYERAVSLGHHCVQLWSLYAAHAAAHWAVPHDVRKLFERAAALVGSDYAASVFWDRYIAFETALAAREPGGDMSRVAALYRRVLRLPLKTIDAYWIRFQQLSTERTSTELIDASTEVELHAEMGLHAAPPQGEDEGARKLRVMPLVEAVYKRAKAEHAPRLALEAAIRRRYYHMKPLDPEEVAHWCSYLDWEEARGDRSQTITTYERCLIPCCESLELWQRYARYLVSQGLVEQARGALSRASGSFLPSCAEMVLYHAGFEEQHANLAAARTLCAAAAALRPPRLEALLAQANLERRASDLPAMRAAYAQGVQLLEGETLCYLLRHALRCERRVAPEEEHGVQLIEAAIAKEPSEAMWSVWLEHEIARCEKPSRAGRGGGQQECENAHETDEELQRVCRVFEKALAPTSLLPESSQQRLWARYIQFAADFMPHVRMTLELAERLRMRESAAVKRARLAVDKSEPTEHAATEAVMANASQYSLSSAYPGYPPDYSYTQHQYPTQYSAPGYGQQAQYGYGYQYNTSYPVNYAQYGHGQY